VRRIVFALMSTAAAVVLLFGYRTSTPHPASAASPAVATGAAGGTDSGSAGTTTVPSTPQSTAAAGGSSSSTATAASATYDGQAVDTRWGPVQVRVTVSSGKLTAVTILEVPSSNGRDVEINDRAVPVLTQEALAAQSANIDSVSGATYTSDGYIGSLQSALDQAGL
jgi:uncharacterized protein with FMN-binding domain